MSYILNALRKSEQERLAQQPDAITDRILVSPAPPRHKRSKLIILLIIFNLIVVACFFWFIRKEPAMPLPVDILKASAPKKIQLKPEVVTVINTPPVAKPIIKKSEPASPTIAELAAVKKTQAPQHSVVKPAAEKEKAPAQLMSDQFNLEREPKPSTATQEEPVTMVERTIKPVAENKTIPFLFELPAEFRHTVPQLNINVFVYDEQPTQRFVMIDMVKYIVGERIKESILLKEIRSDSFVVEYNNRTFRIKRP